MRNKAVTQSSQFGEMLGLCPLPVTPSTTHIVHAGQEKLKETEDTALPYSISASSTTNL